MQAWAGGTGWDRRSDASLFAALPGADGGGGTGGAVAGRAAEEAVPDV